MRLKTYLPVLTTPHTNYLEKLPMLLTRIISTALGTLLLAGCASPPVELSEYGYENGAKAYAGIQKCGTSGYIDPATASLGIVYVKANFFTGYVVNTVRFNEAVHQMLLQYPVGPTKEQCNQVAMNIHARKREIDISNQNVQANEDAWKNIINNRAKQTYCNQIGTQTMCSTY